MSSLLPFIISGIATGAIYGLAGSGLVLSYKTSGIFNFGYGALATADRRTTLPHGVIATHMIEVH